MRIVVMGNENLGGIWAMTIFRVGRSPLIVPKGH